MRGLVYLRRLVTIAALAVTLVPLRGTAWTDLGDIADPDTVSWEIGAGL